MLQAMRMFVLHRPCPQVALLQQQPEVLSVEPSTMVYAHSVTSPTVLGLDEPGRGLWKLMGGEKKAGRGIHFAIVDSGERPHPSHHPPLSTCGFCAS